jgi:hypothetical protein
MIQAKTTYKIPKSEIMAFIKEILQKDLSIIAATVTLEEDKDDASFYIIKIA